MELSFSSNPVVSKLCKLIVSGNSRIRILNDYEDGLINKDSIEYDGHSLKLWAYNFKNWPLDKKCYITFNYMSSSYKLNETTTKKIKHPHIDYIWDYDQFTPSYVLYPIYNVKQETLDTFNIPYIAIDKQEMRKNESIIESDYQYLKYKKNKCSIYPYISKYNIITKLQNKKNINKREKNIIEFSDSESIKSEDSVVSDVIKSDLIFEPIDAFAFDE